ncbi:hypothetical protein F5144DRAFT_571399 [Chaetomium tenue]|uniref:Uncharacterized protein n=1 Tax=Chaetomium tenue TaxID=1854479 RepID=A0ACB7P609_9PEZI|nr:hypothetical protein F5144DRAFT_571399 [Chaetomium globosum]
MMAFEPPSSREDFEIAVVCALPLELDAAVAALDQAWPDDVGSRLGKAAGDHNYYVYGRMGPHNVVLTSLRIRAGQPTMGKVNAAIVASNLDLSYPGLSLVLLVGICGGVPKVGDKEILLGDVVVSSSVVQYDFGRQYPHGFERKSGPQNSLSAPVKGNASVLSHLSMEFGRERLQARTATFLKAIQAHHTKFAFPDPASDRLFHSHYRHIHHIEHDCKCQPHNEDSDEACKEAMESACDKLGCDASYLVERERVAARLEAAASGTELDADVFQPAIHVGEVATGDTVMKSGVGRDTIAKRENVIAFEMEAAGIWEQVPCLVVKAVCDYADSHKNKSWQTYAAATAAAAAKGIAMLHTPSDKAIRRAIDTSRPESILPFMPDPHFVGGTEIFTWLSDMSRRGGERVALVGLGGIGKSQLAIQFAHAIRNKSHVFWVNASTWKTFESSYHDIAERLGLTTPGRRDWPTDTLRKVGNWLGREENGRWTVILDNFDDASILPADDPHLTQLLPQTSHGFVLITSRTSTAADKLTGSSFENLRQVPPMGEEEALELFQNKISNRNAFVEREARELVNLLGCVPLAISQATAHINRPAARMSVRGYADILRGGDVQKSMKLLSTEYQERRRYAGASNAILTTWLATLDKIQREQPRAADLLSLMSFFDPRSIPVRFLKSAYDYNAQSLLSAKNSDALSLTRVKAKLWEMWHKGTYHWNLVPDYNSRLWTEWVKMEPGSKYRGKFQLPIGVFATGAENKRLAKLEAKGIVFPFTLLGHAQAHDDDDVDDDDSGRANDTAEAGTDEKLAADLETLMGYSLVTPSTVEGVLKMHPLVRTCIHMWLTRAGQLAQWKKRSMLAMTVCREGPDSLGIHIEPLIQEEPGPDDAFGAHVWVILADRVWRTENNLDAAEKLIDRTIAVANKAMGPQHSVTLRCLANRAESLCEREKYDEATTLCDDICDRAAKVSYVGLDAVYRSMSIRASILQKRGRFAEGEKEIRTMMEQINKVYAEGDDRTLGYLVRHVIAMVQADMFQEAGDLAVKLIREHWVNKNGNGPIRTAIHIMGGEISTVARGKEGEEIDELLRRIVEAVERVPETCGVFPYNRCDTFHITRFRCLRSQGRDEEAVATMERGIELAASAIPLPSLEPPGLAEDYLEAQDQDEKTRQSMLREIIKNLDGRSGEAFYDSMANVARRLYVQGRSDEGAMLLDAAAGHIKVSHGPDSIDAKGLANLKGELQGWQQFKASNVSVNSVSEELSQTSV